MNLRNLKPRHLGRWRWLVIAAIVLFWTVGHGWARSARHFGYELWPLLVILVIMILSPLVALVDGLVTMSRYRLGELQRSTFAWRIGWAACVLLNFMLILWILKLEGVHFLPA